MKPGRILKKVRKRIERVREQRKRSRFSREDFESTRPLISENSWKRLTEFYLAKQREVRMLEYGSGISTFYHIENLLNASGGELVSVEHDPIWFRGMLASLQDAFGATATSQGLDVRRNGVGVRLQYLLRESSGQTGCGTFEEFESYITAPTGRFDVVIVDGRARRACVEHVLDRDLLCDDGLLVLLEAGRGNERWPKPDQREGTWDYKPAVERLTSLGGEVIDGEGIDNWTDWSPPRKRNEVFSDFVPMEACFYVKRAPA